MNRRIPSLMRRGGRGGGVTTPSLPALADTSVETGYANNVDRMATSSFLPATDDFTIAAMFVFSEPSGSYGMVFSKGFAANGWYLGTNNSLDGRIVARLGGA